MSNTKTSPSKAEEKKTTEKVANGQPSAISQKMSTTKVDEILNPSASHRIKRMENFKLLAERHQFLTKKKDELDKFIISSDGTKERIVLKNAESYEFEVSNSQVVEKVVAVMQEELDLFINRSEKEVLSYNI